MKLIGKILFKGEYLSLMEEEYKNNKRLAVSVVGADGGPYATLSTNIIDADLPDADCFFVKNWSENADLALAIREANIFEVTGLSVPTGRVVAPVWRLRRYIYVVKKPDGQLHGYHDQVRAEQVIKETGADKALLRIELRR